MIQYRRLEKHELTPELFQDFIRHQTVQDCYRKREGRWVIEPAPFIDDWSREEYDFLVQCLKDTIDGNGAVYGAFQAEALGLPGILKGFVSVEGGHMGSRGQYRDMTSLHVSEDLRGHGAGRQLFYWQRTGPGTMGRKSSISPPIRRWRPRGFMNPWAVWMQRRSWRSM